VFDACMYEGVDDLEIGKFGVTGRNSRVAGPNRGIGWDKRGTLAAVRRSCEAIAGPSGLIVIVAR
jgi:hypothetical protein